MTDFKGFNPDKNVGTNFNTNRNHKKNQSEAKPEGDETSAAIDPYADLKMDPDRMMELLATQAKANQRHITAPPGTGNIEKSVAAFEASISPERHSFVSRMLEQTYENEFGKKPSPAMLQDIVDNYLVGQAHIQSS